jgi:hypothetical protein
LGEVAGEEGIGEPTGGEEGKDRLRPLGTREEALEVPTPLHTQFWERAADV